MIARIVPQMLRKNTATQREALHHALNCFAASTAGGGRCSCHRSAALASNEYTMRIAAVTPHRQQQSQHLIRYMRQLRSHCSAGVP